MKKSPGPPMAQIFTILMLLVGIVVILTMRESCASGIANMFKVMDTTPRPDGATSAPPADAGSAAPAVDGATTR